MSILRRRRSLRPLLIVLGLALMGLVVAPGASAAAPLDTVNVTGSTSDGFLTNINISAQSGPSGQNPSGTASAFVPIINQTVSGPVTCLSVTGPDQGPGTPTAPTTATLVLQSSNEGLVKVTVVDNGGNGADQFAFMTFVTSPTDCSTPATSFVTLSPGRAIVFDAPVLPTSKDQCKDGGWQTFGVFKNQGDCVSFVATHGKNPPG